MPSEQEVVEVVDMIWSTTLGFDIQVQHHTDRGGWTLPAVEAQVHIAGTWRGVVVLHTSEMLAAAIARRMFTLDEAPVSPEDVQDAFGEIANITGGNIKGLLSAADAHLSLPSVVRGLDYSVRVPGSKEVVRVEFLSEGEPFVVTVLEAEPARTARDDAHRQTHAVSGL